MAELLLDDRFENVDVVVVGEVGTSGTNGGRSSSKTAAKGDWRSGRYFLRGKSVAKGEGRGCFLSNDRGREGPAPPIDGS